MWPNRKPCRTVPADGDPLRRLGGSVSDALQQGGTRRGLRAFAALACHPERPGHSGSVPTQGHQPGFVGKPGLWPAGIVFFGNQRLQQFRLTFFVGFAGRFRQFLLCFNQVAQPRKRFPE